MATPTTSTSTSGAETSAPLQAFQRELLEHLLKGAAPGEVLDRVCQAVEARVPNTVCSIMVLDPDREALFVESAPCVPADIRAEFDGLVPGELAGACGTAVFTGKPAIIEDTSTDPRWADMRDLAKRAGIKACWSIPVKPDGERAIGSFAMSRTIPGGPTEGVFQLLEAAGFVVGLAVQRLLRERTAASHQEIFRFVVEETQDCIWVKDANGRYVYVNDAEASTQGRTPSEVIGLTDDDLYPPATAERNRATDLEVIRTGRPLSYVVTFETGPDQPEDHRIYHVRKQPRLDGNGKMVEIIGVARNVTEQERARESLQHSQKLESLGLLAGGIAHDFNNILVGILGNAEWLMDQVDGDSSVKESIGEIRTSAERAAALTKQILAYAGKGGLSRQRIDVPAHVRDVLDLVKGSFHGKAQVTISSAERLPQVHGDPTQIRQVLMNLLVNASDAVRDGGHIHLSMESVHADGSDAIPTVTGNLHAGHFVSLTVTDDGVGMDEATRMRMFDPFFTTKAKGRGLGLAAVLGILNAHGGAIQVESVPERGSTVTVYLPVEGAGTSPATPEAQPRATILVVDDEAIVRSATTRLLESAGYAVVTAADGVEALRLIERGDPRPDLALIDQNMPEISGTETCRRIRELDEPIPVLVITGGSDDSELARASVDVIRKPFRRETLLAHLDRVMERNRTKAAET